ncbi:cell wall hydrolase [Candidatus Planktophila limnetica]|uniref:Cell wall hydrolase n=1 Tax=Candidatus Planktophila limnetica TaxID=573600 RepID=A0A249LG51_9ACTN|nr:C40 family peptidase [Candidatus Planktophila limnetica]ASY28091.1 cell wall hydrolase [Candidatus Planktophila limnetica]
MKRVIASLLVLAFMVQSVQAQAAPTVASVQRDIDRLRTLAAEKYEAANEAKIRIKSLQKETGALQQREVVIQEELRIVSKVLAKIAISEFQGSGFGGTFELLFSSDPTKYLSDASVLDSLSKGYSKQLREFETTKQKVQATQLVIADRTSLLIAEEKRLNRQVLEAKSALLKAEKLLKSLAKADRERLLREEAARENKILNDSKGYAASYKGDNTRGSIALKFALQQIGDIYVWAAAGPTRWDCSGLTMRAFQKAGISLPHSSRVQVKYGKSVAYSNVKPGDLLFFGKPISHVSIYMGGGKMVQAPRPGKKVEVVPLTKMFGRKPFVGARRL